MAICNADRLLWPSSRRLGSQSVLQVRWNPRVGWAAYTYVAPMDCWNLHCCVIISSNILKQHWSGAPGASFLLQSGDMKKGRYRTRHKTAALSVPGTINVIWWGTGHVRYSVSDLRSCPTMHPAGNNFICACIRYILVAVLYPALQVQ